jgi:hypothetical protein
MKRKKISPGFLQILDLLRAHSFEVTPVPGHEGAMQVSKHGAGAVLLASEATPVALLVSPGALVNGEIGRLLDRGFQKFIRTSKYELPASAAQLQSIHAFSEELKQVSGAISLYNESLGTTSDIYQYDRLQGREIEAPEPPQPWQLTGH